MHSVKENPNQFKRYLVVASKFDAAGRNIVSHLWEFGKVECDIYLIDTEIIDDAGIDMEKIEQYDFIIFASKHKSEKQKKTLSIHAPGNWRRAELGGKDKKVCPASAVFSKQMFKELHKQAEVSGIARKYDITLECTHHGPFINRPCIFIEIGSGAEEWKDLKAGFVVAKTIRNMIQNFEHNPYNEYAIGIGGPHYCPNFNRIQLHSNTAISHIIPSYALPLDKGMLEEAILKTTEDIDLVVLDWKGLGGSFAREQLVNLLKKKNIRFEKTSEVK